MILLVVGGFKETQLNNLISVLGKEAYAWNYKST